MLYDLQIFSGAFITPSATSRTVSFFFSISNSFRFIFPMGRMVQPYLIILFFVMSAPLETGGRKSVIF